VGKYSSLYFRLKVWIYYSLILLVKEKENAESVERGKGADRKRA
jgi:hypothetical protein